jgi:hypothetical protein
MSIKNIQLFAYNLFKIQYVIIFNKWGCHKNITPCLREVIEFVVTICNILSGDVSDVFRYLFLVILPGRQMFF